MRITNLNKVSTCLVALLICSSINAAQPLNKIVAVVNGDAISQTELDNYTKLMVLEMTQESGAVIPPKDVLQQQILNRMIMNKIQMQLAQEYGIEVDSLTVSQAIQNIAQQSGKTVDEFKKDMEKRGVNYGEYRELLRTEIIIQNLQNKEVHQEIAITKTDIENFLNSPAGQDHSGAEYKLSHILIAMPESPTPDALRKAQAEADQVVAKIKAGADFKQIAISKSSGRQALKGGDLGWRSIGEIPSLFVGYVTSMKAGEIVGPIRSSSGFHIIKMQEKRTASINQNSETHVRQILIKPDTNTSGQQAERTLKLLKQQILKGGDFAKLAIQKSQENRTAEKGGDMGWIDEKAVLPKFYQVMSKLRNNEISEPFETEEGWHLIQVLDRRNQLTSDDAAWNKAREIIGNRKANEALDAWSKRIRDEARVEIISEQNAETKKA